MAGIGNYTEAIKYYDRALAKSPVKVELYHDKADALSKLEDSNDAIKYYDKILAINPEDKLALDGKST